MYKPLLSAHVMVGVGWLGIVAAKLVLGLRAVTASPDPATDLYFAMNVIDGAFPPVAVGTLVTGVLLSLGTKWGLLRHYWVATKLVLAVATVVSVYKPWGKTRWVSFDAAPRRSP